jgi:hypothetical protein
MTASTKKKDAEIPAVNDEIDQSLLSSAPDDWEFETVADASPTKVLFDTIGDCFVGQYEGIQHIVPDTIIPGKIEEFDLYTFRGRDGQLYGINKSYKMSKGMDAVKIGDWVRITYVANIDVRQAEPMKDLKIEVRKNK